MFCVNTRLPDFDRHAETGGKPTMAGYADVWRRNSGGNRQCRKQGKNKQKSRNQLSHE